MIHHDQSMLRNIPIVSDSDHPVAASINAPALKAGASRSSQELGAAWYGAGPAIFLTAFKVLSADLTGVFHANTVARDTH
jgi:hypothetical protein